jgi:pimeloyl-ACP methyl ester carboxylesterase
MEVPSLLRRLVARIPQRLHWRQSPCVRQFDAEDCGAASIATVCLSHGHRLPISLVRQRVGTSAQGTTLLGLKRGAESLGFHARPVQADDSLIDRLDQIPLPAICHWRGNHWVVLHGRRGSWLVVADPAIARSIFERGVSLPAPYGRALITNLAGWDAGEVEAALDCVAVPVLAIQTTTMDTARQRISLQPGQSAPWLDLIRARVPQAETVTLFGSGHFPQIERSDEVNALIAGFARP